MFLSCSERTGTAYFEFQYCKNNWEIKKLIRQGYRFWDSESLLVSDEDDRKFFFHYGKYLESPDGQKQFNPFGPNYYTKEHSKRILNNITEEKPLDWETLADWLKKAVDEYNGFYFFGI